MVYLEQFKLCELKDIFNFLKNEFGLLKKYRIYQLNKFDIVIIMRNSNFFDESQPLHLLFSYRNFQYKFFPQPSKRFYRGEKKECLKFHHKPTLLVFD